MRLGAWRRSSGLMALLALAAIVALAAGSAAFAQPVPTRGGSVAVAVAAEPPGLDPTVSTSQEIARIVYRNVFEGLVRIDRNGDLVPALAERWDVNPSATEYTFYLRQNVRFHDGTPFTSKDVVAKLERARDPESGHTHPEYYRDIESVEAPDDYTVVVKLSQPNAELLFDLARPDSVIYPAGSEETQRSRPVGTGAFKFVEWVRGSHVTLERNEDYWDPALPYLDRVVFRFVPDPNAQVTGLLSGDLDAIGNSLAPENALRIQGTRGFRLLEGSTTTEVILALNNSRAPFNDVRVRRAIAHALNREELVEGAMFGFGTPIGSHMSPAERYYVDLTDRYPYDPAKARELLAEAGYPNGFEATLSLPQPYEYARRSGEVAAAQLAEVGIRLNIEVVEWALWLSRIFSGGDYDMTVIGHSEPFDISIYGNPNYYFRYDNPEVRELLAEARATGDEDRRQELYARIQEVLADDAVVGFLFNLPHLVAVKDDIHGFWDSQPIVSVDMVEVYRAR